MRARAQNTMNIFEFSARQSEGNINHTHGMNGFYIDAAEFFMPQFIHDACSNLNTFQPHFVY